MLSRIHPIRRRAMREIALPVWIIFIFVVPFMFLFTGMWQVTLFVGGIILAGYALIVGLMFMTPLEEMILSYREHDMIRDARERRLEEIRRELR